MANPIPRVGPKTRVLLGGLLVLAAFAVLFDWNWLRHPAEQYFGSRSQREVRIGRLDITFGRGWEPTVHLHDLHVGNAPWADQRPFVVAKEVAFTFALRSLAERRPVVSRLVLVDADVDLERQADGHRNWRLRQPEDVGPGRLKVVRLEARRSRIRFIRRDTGFEVTASAEPLAAPSSNAAGPLTTRVRFEGMVNEAPFSGEAEVGDFLTIMESDASFPIRGSLKVGPSRLEVDGRVANLFKPSRAEGRVHAAGPSLASLHPLLPAKPPASKPFDVEAFLHQQGDTVTAREIRARFGDTVLTGMASFDRTLEPPLLKVALQSPSADLGDLLPATRSDAADAAMSAPEDVGTPASSDRLFPANPLDFGKLGALDAELSLSLKKLRAEGFPGLERFKAEVRLKDGVLEVVPDIGLAEGRVAGTVRVDGRADPARLHAKIDARDMRLEKLLAGRRLQGTVAGPVQAHLDLEARGNSIAAMAGSLTGTARGGMENGVLSGLAAAALELNLGKIVKALVSGNRPIGITRVDTAFDFDAGKASARVFFIDTEQTRVVGTGNLNLRDETLDLVLTPYPKHKSLFALDSAIRVHGPMRDPQVGLDKSQRASLDE